MTTDQTKKPNKKLKYQFLSGIVILFGWAITYFSEINSFFTHIIFPKYPKAIIALEKLRSSNILLPADVGFYEFTELLKRESLAQKQFPLNNKLAKDIRSVPVITQVSCVERIDLDFSEKPPTETMSLEIHLSTEKSLLNHSRKILPNIFSKLKNPAEFIKKRLINDKRLLWSLFIILVGIGIGVVANLKEAAGASGRPVEPPGEVTP